MPKIVILGSLSKGDYEVTYPVKVCEDYHNEAGYLEACKKFYPAIESADLVIAWLGETAIVGEHTKRDMEYAFSKGKRIVLISSVGTLDIKGAKK